MSSICRDMGGGDGRRNNGRKDDSDIRKGKGLS
jgi:hypothetical protein